MLTFRGAIRTQKNIPTGALPPQPDILNYKEN
jgi:hypothetical protein